MEVQDKESLAYVSASHLSSKFHRARGAAAAVQSVRDPPSLTGTVQLGWIIWILSWMQRTASSRSTSIRTSCRGAPVGTVHLLVVNIESTRIRLSDINARLDGADAARASESGLVELVGGEIAGLRRALVDAVAAGYLPSYDQRKYEAVSTLLCIRLS
jgi:hypothetical protein